jgi:hypothetical protein
MVSASAVASAVVSVPLLASLSVLGLPLLLVGAMEQELELHVRQSLSGYRNS